MAFFDNGTIGNFTCATCGNVYRVESTITPDKEKEWLKCDCGAYLIEPHRTRHNYAKTFLRKGDPADAAENPEQ
jgi:NAD-dependent SIR2 family protein deacetylase